MVDIDNRGEEKRVEKNRDERNKKHLLFDFTNFIHFILGGNKGGAIEGFTGSSGKIPSCMRRSCCLKLGSFGLGFLGRIEDAALSFFRKSFGFSRLPCTYKVGDLGIHTKGDGTYRRRWNDIY